MLVPTFVRLSQIIGDRKNGITPIIPISRSSFLNGVANGHYPKPIKLGQKSVAWRYLELIAAVEAFGGCDG